MKKELVPYDHYYETNGQSAMMVANGHPGLHPMHHHPFNLEDNFLHILGKNPKCHQYLNEFFFSFGGATSAYCIYYNALFKTSTIHLFEHAKVNMNFPSTDP